MFAQFATRISGFYLSVAYGFVTLILPIFVIAGLLSWGLSWLLPRGTRSPGRLPSFGFVFAFALIGGVTGVIAGASLEPIVGASLTAILGIVSSLLAYLFSRTSLRVWRPVLPLAIIAMFGTTLVGIVFGGSQRTQLLAQNREAEWEQFQRREVFAPVQREQRLLIARRCIAETEFERLYEDCGQ